MDHNNLERMRNSDDDQGDDGDYVLDYNSHFGAVGRRHTFPMRQANENVGAIPLFNHSEQTVWQRQSTYDTHEESKSQQTSQSPFEHRLGSYGNVQIQDARQNPMESPRGRSNLLSFEIDRQPFRRSNDLDKWKHALGNVHETEILPPELGGQADLNYLSWKGEHFLNCEAVKVIDKEFASNFKTKGKAAKILATAFSSSFLSINKTDILLDHMYQHTTESDLNIGTIVEAAVSVIYDTNEEAVRDLARYLLRKAENVPTPNAKGSLIQIGGEVTIVKKEGSSHQPLFTARARLNNQVAEAEATSKKKAEQLACERLLDHLGL